MTIVHYVIVVLLVLLSVALTWALTKYYYLKIIATMTTRNLALIERFKKAESIILHDILQLTPDDLNLLKKKTGDTTNHITTNNTTNHIAEE